MNDWQELTENHKWILPHGKPFLLAGRNWRGNFICGIGTLEKTQDKNGYETIEWISFELDTYEYFRELPELPKTEEE